VKVFDGATHAEISSFFAYDVGFTGGVFVAVGDINGDGYGEVVTGSGQGARPHVKVFDGRTGGLMQSFFPL
jgi:serralysin